MGEIVITDEMFEEKPMDDPRYEYRGTEVQGVDILAPTLKEDLVRAADYKLHQLDRTYGKGWHLYWIHRGNPFEANGQPFNWPTMFFRRTRRPGSAFTGPELIPPL